MSTSDKMLPDREIAYNYTAAMHFAQHFEVNLKAILHTIDYSFEDLEESLNPGELKRFKTFERFVDKATAGALKTKLMHVGVSLPEKAWALLDEACETRNDLAHKYLERLRLPPPNEEHRDAILKNLQGRAILLYQAMMITQTARQKLEETSERQHQHMNDFLKECGIDPSSINKGLWDNKTQ